MDIPSKPQDPAESRLHFLDYWRIIRIRKNVILAVFLIVLVTTALVTAWLPKSYRSTVRIDVRKDAPDIAPLTGFSMPVQFDPYFIQTEFQKIKSKSVLHKVITDLNLPELWREEFGKGITLTVAECYELLEKLTDVQQSRNTSLIEIQVYGKDKQLAADIANKIAEIYGDSRRERQTEYSKRGVDELQVQLADQNRKIEVAQSELDRLREQLNVTDSIVEGMNSTPIEPETVRRIEYDRTTALAKYVELDSLLSSLKGKTGEDQIQAVGAISFQFVGSILPNLLADRAQTQQSLVRLGIDLADGHPQMQQLRAMETKVQSQIEQAVDSVMQGLEVQTLAASNRVAELEARVNSAKDKDIAAAIENKPYYQQKRAVENMKRIRDAILLRMIQEQVDAALPKESIVEITDPAEPGKRPVRPNIPINIALGMVVGLVLGVGLAFFIEYLDTSVKTIDDVERALQAPVIGVIPQNVGSLMDEGEDSPHAEAYRVLRTNVLFSRENDQCRTLTVVSGGAGEGKSTTIFNLANIFAQNGSRVLLIDSDLRRPSLHKIMGVSNSHGLTDLLLETKTIEEVTQTSGNSELDFIPSGRLPSNSMGILNSAKMRSLLNEFKQHYDFVFFDSPPIMGVSDASILASEVDMSILVIQYRKYPQAMTLRAKQMVEKVGGTVLGVVLNNINISQDSYYYYYSGYYYDYYSKQNDESGDASSNGGVASSENGDRSKIDLKGKF